MSHDTRATPAALGAAAEILDYLRREYGEKFIRQWASISEYDLLRHWANRLTGYTAGEVRRGLLACGMRPYPPTVPEFLGLCRPAPEPEAAYHEAVAGMQARRRGARGEWSHPAIYWAAVHVSAHDLLGAGYQALRPRWEYALRESLGRGAWPEIPEPVPVLPAPGSRLTSRDEALQRLAELGRACARPPGSAADPRRWAARVLAREQAGVDRPSAAVLRAARRASET